MYLIGCKLLQSFETPTTDILYHEYTMDVFNCFDDIDTVFKEQQMMALSPEFMEEELFGEAKKEPKEDAGEDAPKKSFVTRLGAKIRELIAKLKEMMTKFLSHFKKEDQTMKQQQALIDAAFHQDPSLKNQVIELAKSGNLNFTDIKNINELQDEVNKLLEEKNPTTLKGKFEKLKKKWEDPENTKTVKRVKAAGTIISVVTAIIGIGTALGKRKTTIMDASQETQRRINSLMRELEANPDAADNMGYYQTKIAINKWLMGQQGEAMAILSGDMRNVNGLLRVITRGLDSTKIAKNKQTKELRKMRQNLSVADALYSKKQS